MQPEHKIQVRADENSQLRCVTCQDLMVDADITILIRLRRGGPFDPLCVECSHAVIRHARESFDFEQEVVSYFK